MGVVAIDAAYGKVELMEPIRRFLDDWKSALFNLYKIGRSDEEASRLSRQLVSDFEGAILLSRIYGDTSYIDAVTERGALPLEGLDQAS